MHGLWKPKKPKKNLEKKKSSQAHIFVLGNLKVEKYLSGIHHRMEPGYTRSTILVAKFNINNNFLSLSSKFNDFLSPLWNYGLKTKKNKVLE
jgi:hypothetical protein